MPNRPLPLAPPDLLALHGAPPGPGLAAARHGGEGPHGLDDLVLALTGEEARDARDELVDAVRVLHHDARVCDGERDGHRAGVLHAGDQRPDLALEPCTESAKT